MNQRELKEHVAGTYHSIRLGIAGVAIALPFLLWIGGRVRAGLPLQQSMSAYYHSGNGAMRDVFVGVLCAVGIVLFLYKGFTHLENHALNLAGLFLVAVAMFPTELDAAGAERSVSVHGTSAVLFFLCIAYVCLFRAEDTVAEIRNERRQRWYRGTYKSMGVLMIVFPLSAVLLSLLLQPRSEGRATIFFAEMAAVLVFGAYWILKSYEIRQSSVDRHAIEGKLCTRPHGPRDMFKQIPVERDATAAADAST